MGVNQRITLIVHGMPTDSGNQTWFNLLKRIINHQMMTMPNTLFTKNKQKPVGP